MKDRLIDYNDISFEQKTLFMEIEDLSDDALIDECAHIMAGVDTDYRVDSIISSYFKSGEITKEQRKAIERLYVLAYADLGWED